MLKIKEVLTNEPNIEPNFAARVLTKQLNINTLTMVERSQKRTQSAWVSNFKSLNLRKAILKTPQKRTQPPDEPRWLVG